MLFVYGAVQWHPLSECQSSKPGLFENMILSAVTLQPCEIPNSFIIGDVIMGLNSIERRLCLAFNHVERDSGS